MKRFLKIITISVLIISIIGGCKKEEKTEPSPTVPVYTDGEGEIGSMGGTVSIIDENSPLNGVSVQIPAGALNEVQNIKIQLAPDDIIFPGDSTLIIIEFLPQGLTFEEPITITIPYSNPDTSQLGVYYYNPNIELISQLPKSNIDQLNKTISGLTDHFSYYVAWDRTVRMMINMIRTENGIIGARLFVYGEKNNIKGFKYIPTTLLHSLQTGEFNAWKVLSNSEYSNLYSLFRVNLYEDRLIGNDFISSSGIDMSRVQSYWGGSFAADIYKSNGNETIYESGDLINQDIGGNYKNLGRWFSGEPLLFLFEDFTPDPNKKYFVKTEWTLAYERTGWTALNYTPIFEFHNKPDKQKISDMQFVNIDDIDNNNNNIWDDFEVWGSSLAPVGDFEADITTASPGQTIHFTDLSANDPTSWQWDFGDGGTSNQQHPSYTYSIEGSYTVSLTATNEYGNDTEVKSDYIHVELGGLAPVAAFSATPTNGTIPLTVNFSDLSTNNPTSWQWDFGDGGSSNQHHPSYTYSIEGSYTVSLTATNEYGNDIEVKSNYIHVESGGLAPVAGFSATPTSGTIPLTVNFSDLSTNNPTSWQWDFGDGGTSNQQHPSYTYSSEGSYTVSLTVTNEYGTDTEVKSNYIIVSSAPGGEPCPGIPTITYQGQTYNTVLIGNQCWMKENLNWETGNSWCYDDDPANCNVYGRLYDWETIMNGEPSSNSVPSGVQGICPDGWHIPSDEEWKILEGTVDSQYTVGDSEWDDTGYRGFDAGKHIKTVSGWYGNGNGTNNFNFSAVPAGYRFFDGNFYFAEQFGWYWSSTEYNNSYAWYRELGYNNDEISRVNFRKDYGFSVRCIKE